MLTPAAYAIAYATARVLSLRADLFFGAYAALRSPQFCLRHTLTWGPFLNMNTRV
jgi:hypothetical protein